MTTDPSVVLWVNSTIGHSRPHRPSRSVSAARHSTGAFLCWLPFVCLFFSLSLSLLSLCLSTAYPATHLERPGWRGRGTRHQGRVQRLRRGAGKGAEINAFISEQECVSFIYARQAIILETREGGSNKNNAARNIHLNLYCCLCFELCLFSLDMT